MVKLTFIQKLQRYSKLDKCLEVRGNKLFCKKCCYPISADQRGHVVQV